jgi:hypothetical protein
MKKLVSDYLNHLTLSTKQSYRNMAVFPLLCDREGSSDYLLLDEALEENLIDISEVDESGTVPELMVENRSEKNLLILDGEELVGAKQNRIVNVTILIAAHATLTIPVSCVEQGRWSYQSRRFTSKERVMPPRMRMKKSAAVYNSLLNDGSFTANQTETWDMIEEKLSAHNVDSATASMGDIYDQEQDVIDDYMKHFSALDNQVGMVVMINNQVIGSDCFARHSTLQRTFPKLLKSYVLDAIDADEKKNKYLSSSKKATCFLGDVGNCLAKERPSISLGTDIRLVSQKVIGSALSVNDEVVHLTAFARDEKETKKKIAFYQRASRRKTQK